ncbi:MAG TPA: type IX secretion system membrane protein PorP/SprF [Draconibacterium sp.]|nr:type IX secretion system membrane protein PorP/SprF [Draconibacterium sp.]
MNVFRKIGFALLVVLLAAKIAEAQQDPMYTQYMDNLQIINPGYVGSLETGSFTLVARNQWVSFSGAPSTRSFSYQTPVKEFKVGMGFSVMTDKIGPLAQTGFYFDYSYFLRVGYKYKLGMGLKGGFSFYRASLTELNTVSPDPIYSKDIFKNFLPNFGVGAFLYSDDTYFGLSVPKLVENTISREDYTTEYVNKEKIHFYFVAGKKFSLSENTQLKASTMLKLVQNAPVSVDITGMIGFKERFWVGGMFRYGDSYGLLTQFNVTDKILIGYSYDLTLSDINVFSNGTHEIMFRYNMDIFGHKKPKSN